MRTSTLPLLAAIALSSLLAACGSTVTGEDEGEDGGTGGGDTTGTGVPDCTPDPLNCQFEGRCVGETWVCDPCPAEICPPPVHECPEFEPVPLTSCPDISEGETCEYPSEMDCGPAFVSFTCEDGVWSQPSYPRCSPLVCGEILDPEACDASGCRWREPGCGEDPIPLPAAGCFDVEPCTEGSCWNGDEICMPVSVLPDCVDEGCDACGIVESLCVPQLVGE